MVLGKSTVEALTWIVPLLRRNGIRFQLTGGFAAQAYGARRRLRDIDITVRKADLAPLAATTRPYVIFGPQRVRDTHWDLHMLTVNYRGQLIDFGSVSAKIFNRGRRRWDGYRPNLRRSTIRSIAGLRLPLEPRESLIRYKRKLARAVDRTDVEQMVAHKRRERRAKPYRKQSQGGTSM